MKKILKYLSLSVVATVFLSSCGDDFLDKYPYTSTTGEYNKTEATVKLSLNGVYNTLFSMEYSLGYGVPGYIAYDSFTGLCYEREENTTIGAGGGLTPGNDLILSYWKMWYLTIARANTLISTADPKLSTNNNIYIAEARVLRALGYYYLISVYGDVPLFKESVTVDEFLSTRTSREEILNYILDEMDACAGILPSWTASERGRVDKAVAYSLKARAALLGGSLNYGGNGEKYYRIAAEAAAQVIGKRKLATNFDDLFTSYGQKKSDVRDELILEVMFSNSGTARTHLIAFGNVSRFYGQTLRHPSQRLVDTYECIDGKRIDESPLYDPRNPKKNRDPRFRSTIWMHGDTATGNITGTSAGRIKFVLNAFEGADRTTRWFNYGTGKWETKPNLDFTDPSAYTSFTNRGVGYMWRKFSNDTIESVSASTVHFPLIRYAEVLLTYAEAKIELGELDNSVYDAINQVRNRSHMPNVSADRIGDANKMKQLVRRERKVELVLEGLHLADMRRWGIGDIENDGPSYGMPKEESGGYEGFLPHEIPNFRKTERHDLNDLASYDAYAGKLKVRDANRYWEKRFELWPIPQSERNIDHMLTQNDGY